MAGWTIIPLPKIGVSMFAASRRSLRIAKWVTANNLDENAIGISSKVVRFKNPEDAVFFQLSFKFKA